MLDPLGCHEWFDVIDFQQFDLRLFPIPGVSTHHLWGHPLVERHLLHQRQQLSLVVAQVVGFLKGKSAIHIARVFSGRRRNFVGQQFWARGYYVSTVGKDEQAVRKYIKEQKATDRQLDQLKLD